MRCRGTLDDGDAPSLPAAAPPPTAAAGGEDCGDTAADGLQPAGGDRGEGMRDAGEPPEMTGERGEEGRRRAVCWWWWAAGWLERVGGDRGEGRWDCWEAGTLARSSPGPCRFPDTTGTSSCRSLAAPPTPSD